MMFDLLLYLGLIVALFPTKYTVGIELAISLIWVSAFVLTNRKFQMKNLTKYSVVILVLFIYSLLSYFWVLDKYYWALYNVMLFIGFSYSVWLPTCSMEKNRIRYRLQAIIEKSLIVHLLIAIFEIFSRRYIFSMNPLMIPFARLRRNPLTFFHNTNDFAFYILMIYLFLRINGDSSKNKFYNLLFFPVAFVIYMTESRLVLISLIITFILVFVFTYFSKNFIKISIFLLSITIVFLTFLFSDLIQNFFQYLRHSEPIRTNLIHNGFEYLKMTKYVGVGAGNILYYLQNVQIKPTYGIFSMHNWWLEILVTYGIFCFSIYSLYYLSIIRKAINLKNKWIVAWFVSFIFASISSSNIFTTAWVWIFLAFMFTVTEKGSTNESFAHF
ncbi:O-antigen ligase family protein [Streptococcus suis]